MTSPDFSRDFAREDLSAAARVAELKADELMEAGELEACAAACDQAMVSLRELGDEARLCDILIVKALALNELGLTAEALDCLAVARELAARLDDRTHLYWVLNRVGVVHKGMGDFRLGREFMLRALELAADLDQDVLFCILNNLADAAGGLARQQRERGEPGIEVTVAEGLEFAERALPLARVRPSRYGEVLILDNLGMLLGLAGQFDRAREMLAEAHVLTREHGYQSIELSLRWHAASILVLEGRAAEAEPQLAEILEAASAMGELQLQLEVLLDLSEAHERTGRFEVALRRYKEHVALQRQLNSTVAATRARVLVTHVDLDVARLDAADARTESELYLARSRELEAEKQELERRALELDRRANEDALTRLSNRHHLNDELPRMFARNAQDGRPLTVAVLDIDLFKQVNDTFGHPVGDAVLVEVAQLLTRNRRVGDLVARLGGEEFLVAFANLEEQEVLEVCQRLRRGVQEHDWPALHPGLAVTVSIGVVTSSPGQTLPEVLDRVDALLYRAKRGGRNRVEWDSPEGASDRGYAAGSWALRGSNGETGSARAMPDIF